MTILEVARKTILLKKKDDELREKGYMLDGFFIANNDGKKYRLSKSIPEMISKLEKVCESECCKCILNDGITCDGSLLEIASCKMFEKKELALK